MEGKLQIQVHHIGGIGDCGPVEQMTILNKDVVWNFYDADRESLEKCNTTNKNFVLLGYCIGSSHKKKMFNVAVNPSASSLLKPSESAKDYTFPDSNVTWGEHSKIIDTNLIQIEKIDTLIKKGEINPIDMLSIDVQGGELNVLKGAKESLKDIMAVVCEVEFSQIYEKQPLFPDIQKFMNKNGFRLCALYNLQYWPTKNYPKELMGYGYLTVAEALFLREPNFDNLIDDKIIKLLKLGAIAVCFNQRDVAITILHELEKRGFNINELDKNGEFYYITKFKQAIMEANNLMKW
jgi:FkbM family methyltransferase